MTGAGVTVAAAIGGSVAGIAVAGTLVGGGTGVAATGAVAGATLCPELVEGVGSCSGIGVGTTPADEPAQAASSIAMIAKLIIRLN